MATYHCPTTADDTLVDVHASRDARNGCDSQIGWSPAQEAESLGGDFLPKQLDTSLDDDDAFDTTDFCGNLDDACILFADMEAENDCFRRAG